METDPHANSIVAMRNQPQWHFEGLGDVYVAGSVAMYYREGDPSAVVAPDVFAVLGVEKRARKSYRIWDEGGVVPAFVVEVASLSTSRRDATSKRETYEQMGVREYWRFDPLGERVRHGLEGWRMAVAGYDAVLETGPAGWYRSEVLGLELRAEEWLLRFRDPRLGRDLMTHRKPTGPCRNPTGTAIERSASETTRWASGTRRIAGSRDQRLGFGCPEIKTSLQGDAHSRPGVW